MAPTVHLRRKRESLVREHMDSENRHEFDATLETFHHPRYELVATDDVYDGTEEVERYFEETRRAFPTSETSCSPFTTPMTPCSSRPWSAGPTWGPLRSLPPTGREFELPILSIFVFEEDKLICERVYFDQNTLLRQLGIARDPLSVTGRLETLVGHPLTIGRGVVRRLIGR